MVHALPSDPYNMNIVAKGLISSKGQAVYN